MRELITAEFYKLFKSVGFRVCIIVFLARDIIYLITVGFVGDILGLELTGYSQFQYLLGVFSGSSVSGMLFGFMAASLITSDYKSRDFQCAIAQGHSRGNILTVKIIIYTVALWMLSLEDVVVYIVGASIGGGFGTTFTADTLGYMLRALVCEGFVMTMMYMTCVFLAFVLSSKAASVSVNLLLFFVIDLGVQILPVLIRSDILDKILGYLPFNSVREMGQVDIDWSHAGIALAVAAAWGAFRKKDLR